MEIPKVCSTPSFTVDLSATINPNEKQARASAPWLRRPFYPKDSTFKPWSGNPFSQWLNTKQNQRACTFADAGFDNKLLAIRDGFAGHINSSKL